MGYIEKLSCDCGYRTELYLGTGRLLPDAAYIQSLFPAERLKEFNAALKCGILGKPFYIENTLCYCGHCKGIREGRTLHFQIGDVEKSVFGVCPDCGEDLTPAEGDPLCPKCGKPLLSEPGGLWD